MRKRMLSVGLSVALAVPAVGAGLLAVVTTAAPAGAVSTTPAWSLGLGGWNRSSSPTIADVDGDGRLDVVIGHQDGWLRVISGVSGHPLTGWPQPANVAGGATAIDSTPAVADLFKNGQNEIIVGTGSTWVHNQQGGVIVFNRNGSRHCVFRTRDDGNIWANTGNADGFTEPVFSSPAIGDIDGDGFPDIVFGAFDGHVYGIDRNCNKILDENVEDSVWSSPALFDIDGDGRMEIFIGGDQAAGGAIDWSGGEFRAIKFIRGAPGNAVELWKRQIHDTVWSSPAIGDIDGDGRVEVVVGAGFFYQRDDGRRVYAWHADNGSNVTGWPVTTAGFTMSSPALGDLTGDGIPEVATSSSDGWVRVYRGNGSLLWAKHLTFDRTAPGGAVASPIIADMNGDGHNDVGAGNNWGYFVLNGVNGTGLAAVDTWKSYESAGAVGYFGGVGWRLIVEGFDTPHHTSSIQAFDIPTPPTPPPWPMFRHDAAHHAGPVANHLLPPGYCRRSVVPTPHPVPGSSNGYWVAAADGSVFALHGAPYRGNARGRMFGHLIGLAPTASGNGYLLLSSGGEVVPLGDARSYGSMVGHRLNAPIIAFAATPTGHGYWLLARDGGVFTFGDARFRGSLGGHHLNAPILGMAVTPSGRGYWLVGADGGVFTFGDATFHGSMSGRRLSAPMVSIAPAARGAGYWLMAADGGVFSFGAPFYGSIPAIGLCRPPAGMQIRRTLTGNGYYVLGADGKVFAFGDAQSGGSARVQGYAMDLAIRS